MHDGDVVDGDRDSPIAPVGRHPPAVAAERGV
jgi:hypothetical protein